MNGNDEVAAANTPRDSDYVDFTAEIVAAYLGHNDVPARDIPDLIKTVHAALRGAARLPEPVAEAKPAVPVKRSIQPDYLICLEDGKRFKSLKRHLRTHYGLSPDEYRRKWKLAPDYPMVAPNYARARSELARITGLGQQRRKRKAAAE
jgi:predicted transcriptional regulator